MPSNSETSAMQEEFKCLHPPEPELLLFSCCPAAKDPVEGFCEGTADGEEGSLDLSVSSPMEGSLDIVVVVVVVVDGGGDGAKSVGLSVMGDVVVGGGENGSLDGDVEGFCVVIGISVGNMGPKYGMVKLVIKAKGSIRPSKMMMLLVVVGFDIVVIGL